MNLKGTAAVIHAFTIALLASSANASTNDPNANKTLSPYFFVEGGDAFIDRMPLESTSASIVVSGVIAEVTVRQRYVNRGARPIHAKYVFPGSTRAAVNGMRFTLGDQVILPSSFA